MPICKIKDIIYRVKDKVSLDCGLKHYVAGEHFDSNEVVVSNKGNIEGSTIGPAFHMRFKPGQVLLMSRNPHLRKAGIVNFEGICSDVSYVCETKDEYQFKQKLIPFLFQSDVFWKKAEENKRGSTNFFLNWSDFEEFEINIPEPEEQEYLCNLLWAGENVRQLYKKLLQKTDDVIKAKFIEMFGDINNRDKFEHTKWSEVVSIVNGKEHKQVSGNGKYGVYGTGGKMLNCREYMCEPGTIIMGRKGTIDKPYIVHEKCWIVDTAFGVNSKSDILNNIYLFYYIKQINYTKLNKAATLPSVTKSDLLKLDINIPPIE